MTSIRQADILHDLQCRIRGIELGQTNPKRIDSISSGFARLDRLLPQRGFVGGTLIEWIAADEGSGGMTLALVSAASVARTAGMAAIISERQTLFPPALAGLRMPLERTVLVRPKDQRTCHWIWEQTLRCEGVAVAVGQIEGASVSTMRRLRLAVEAGGGLGFIVRPAESRDETMWADVRIMVKALPGRGEAWRMRVELVRCRGGFGGGFAEVEVGYEANDVCLDSELARPASSP